MPCPWQFLFISELATPRIETIGVRMALGARRADVLALICAAPRLAGVIASFRELTSAFH